MSSVKIGLRYWTSIFKFSCGYICSFPQKKNEPWCNYYETYEEQSCLWTEISNADERKWIRKRIGRTNQNEEIEKKMAQKYSRRNIFKYDLNNA